MRIIILLVMSHALVCTGDHGPDFLFPQMEYITNTPRYQQVSYQNQSASHVSHISHALPGRSSMSITRTYRKPSMSHNNIGLSSLFDSGHTSPSLSGMRYSLPSKSSMSYNVPNKLSMGPNIQSQPSISYDMPNQSSMVSDMPIQSSISYNKPNQSGSSYSMPSQSGSSYRISSQSGSSQNMPNQSGSSHTMPSQSGRSHTMPSQSGSSHTMPSQSGSSHTMPSQSGSRHNIPSQSSMNYEMPSQSGSSYNIPSQSTMSYNTPSQSKKSLYMTYDSSYGRRYGPLEQSFTSQSLRSGKSSKFNTIGHSDSNHHKLNISDSKFTSESMSQESKDTQLYPRTTIQIMSSTPADRNNNYDYQSLSRDQVDSHVFSVMPHDSIDSIETDHSIGQPDDSLKKSETKHVISNNMITHPVISSNIITHQNNIDTSHSVNEEMVDFQSPMLTSQTSTGPRTGGTPGPFAPRFQVPKWEISDTEWEEEIKEGFVHSGLVPDLIPEYPPGLVNINYGVHGCVHLGTRMQAETTSSPPSRVSFPSEPHRIYTLIFLDVNKMQVNWMVINIPGSEIQNGQTIAEYQPPAPWYGYKDSQYVAVALLQSSVINKSNVAGYSSKLCEYGPRTNFDLKRFMTNFGLEMIVAANYFVVHRDTYVESIESYCHQFHTVSHGQLSV